MRSGWKKKPRTHCLRGHELTEENTYVFKQGHRIVRGCKTCRTVRETLYLQNHPQQRADTARWSQLKSLYGLTKERFEKLLVLQNGLCPVCMKPFMPKQTPYVDHNHDTSEIRGLLHLNCNAAIGQLGDNPVILRNAAVYLENPPARNL